MNKLVSKSLIQRFKQGNKIRKMQNASGGSLWGKNIIGSQPYVGDKKMLKYTWPDKNINENVSGVVINDAVQRHNNTPNIIKVGTTPGMSIEELRKQSSSISKNQSSKTTKPQSSSTAKSSITVKSKPRSGWSYGYNRSNEISDIKATQQMLKDAGYLFSDKYDVVDGKWGNDTENAYKKYLLNKEKPVVAPTIQQISQTPLDNTIRKGFTQVMNTPPIIANLPKQPVRGGNFNKSQIRNLISQGGFDPYKYTGAQRKALRLYLNGESNDTSLLDGTDLARFTLPFRKQGGQLISRNPVERFKNKIK